MKRYTAFILLALACTSEEEEPKPTEQTECYCTACYDDIDPICAPDNKAMCTTFLPLLAERRACSEALYAKAGAACTEEWNLPLDWHCVCDCFCETPSCE